MLVIDPLHTGPATSGHGGVSAGRFAEAAATRAARVRFHRPVPLATPLRTHTRSNDLIVKHQDDVIATVFPLESPLEVQDFDVPTLDEIAEVETRFLADRGGRHVAPACFACGTDRRSPGLGLRPTANGAGLHVCSWTPAVEGTVPDWLVWAALDCPTGIPALDRVPRDEAVVTGELSVDLLADVIGGHTYRILSRLITEKGRRFATEALMVDADGQRVALAKATWIRVGAEVFGAAA